MPFFSFYEKYVSPSDQPVLGIEVTRIVPRHCNPVVRVVLGFDGSYGLGRVGLALL